MLDTGPGDTLTVSFRHAGEGRSARLAVTDFPTTLAEKVAVLGGMKVVTVTPAVRAERNIQSDHGALIYDLPDEMEEATGLRSGDVILQINRCGCRAPMTCAGRSRRRRVPGRSPSGSSARGVSSARRSTCDSTLLAVGRTAGHCPATRPHPETAMADTIRRVSYYYTTISDKPGEGARLLETLRERGVNLLAFHAFPSARKAQVDFVPSTPPCSRPPQSGEDQVVEAEDGLPDRRGRPSGSIGQHLVAPGCGEDQRYGRNRRVRGDGAIWGPALGEAGCGEQSCVRAWSHVASAAGSTPAEGVRTKLLAHLVDHSGDDPVALGLERLAGTRAGTAGPHRPARQAATRATPSRRAGTRRAARSASTTRAPRRTPPGPIGRRRRGCGSPAVS